MTDHIPDTEKMVEQVDKLDENKLHHELICRRIEALEAKLEKTITDADNECYRLHTRIRELEANQKFIYEALHTIIKHYRHDDPDRDEEDRIWKELKERLK